MNTEHSHSINQARHHLVDFSEFSADASAPATAPTSDSIVITDHWRNRGSCCIKLTVTGAERNESCEFPYDDSHERRDQLQNAINLATRVSARIGVNFEDKSDDPVAGPAPETLLNKSVHHLFICK